MMVLQNIYQKRLVVFVRKLSKYEERKGIEK